jgi:polygalacturonase
MFHKTVPTGRRNLLRLSVLLVAVVSASIGRVTLAQTDAPSAAEALFGIRTYRVSGYGKTVDTTAIKLAIETVAAAALGTLHVPKIEDA